MISIDLTTIARLNRFSIRTLFRVLEHIVSLGEEKTVGEIANALGYSYSQTYKAIHLLSAYGLLRIKRVPHEGAGYPYRLFVSATQKGIDVLREEKRQKKWNKGDA